MPMLPKRCCSDPMCGAVAARQAVRDAQRMRGPSSDPTTTVAVRRLSAVTIAGLKSY